MLIQDSHLPVLIDLVCGMPSAATSPHHFAHSGAMFYFCSEACRACFIADPFGFVDMRVPEHDAPALVPVPAPTAVREEPTRPVAGEQSARKSGRELEHRLQRGGLRGWIASRLHAWRERLHATRTSRELLALYRAISADHPDLSGRELYKLVVMARTRCDLIAANAVLECAEESFAVWPVRRELTLCDVVHYLAVAEFLAAHEDERWMHSNIKLVVASSVPSDLCILRKK